MKSIDIPYKDDLNKADFLLNDLLFRIGTNRRVNWKDIYKGSGVYIVYHLYPYKIKFNSSAGPSSAIPTDQQFLINKWSKLTSQQKTDIIYIGRGNVKKRIRSLIRFGLGLAVNHSGGEWLWQIEELQNLRIMISSCPEKQEMAYENFLLNKFKVEHNDWPLANRTGGNGIEIWHP